MTTHKRFQLTLNADQDLIPREMPAQRVLEIVIQAPDANVRAARPALNLALVLDRSGSMAGEKLEYVKQACMHVLDLLSEQDHVALVVFDDEVNLLSPSLPVTGDNREDLKQRIRLVQTGGSTNLSGGWLTGCQEVATVAGDGIINRALLLTDGQANAGITDLEELAMHARELARRGVSTSTFGVGQGFNEHLLEAMANQGNGSFYYIASPKQVPDLFAREFAELAAVTARDVELVVQTPPQVSAAVLGGWRMEQRGSELHIAVGNLYAGRSQELYIKLLTPPAGKESQLVFGAQASAQAEDGQSLSDNASVTFTYAGQAESEAAPRRMDVLQRFAGVELAEIAGEALKLERNGEGEKASRLLKQTLESNREYADPAKLREYENLSDRMKRGMDEYDRKSSHMASYNQKRRREP